MKLIIFFCFICIFSVYLFSRDANPNNNNNLAAFKDSIDKYYYSFNTFRLKSILNDVNLYDSEKSEIFYCKYYSGLITYCLGRIYYNRDKDSAYSYFLQSLDFFLDADEIKKIPENTAMISAVYGKLSSLSTLKAIYYGLKAKSFIVDAYEADSLSSKVLIVAATHLMHTPAFYGGDKKKARELLNKIPELNKKSKESEDLLINWGTDEEAFAYLAQLEILEDNLTDARKYIKKALNLRKNYGFVLYDLEYQLRK